MDAKELVDILQGAETRFVFFVEDDPNFEGHPWIPIGAFIDTDLCEPGEPPNLNIVMSRIP
jgi:hypothetical protein